MPKTSALSLAMRSKKENSTPSALSPRSPRSPNAIYGNDSETATPIAPYPNGLESPTSPKPRKDSKNIFSNFSASKSSSRINSPDHTIRQVQEQNLPAPFYTNGCGGGSTPDLNRSSNTPNSEDNRLDNISSVQRTNSAPKGANNVIDPNPESSQFQKDSKSKKQGVLSRSRSIKAEGNKGQPKKKEPPRYLSESSTTSLRVNGDTAPLKTAPIEKGQSWRQNIAFGKLRTQSADRHDPSQQSHPDDDNASRRDKAEASSVASGSFNESRGAALMSSLGSASRKMGEKMETARKGVFGKLGRTTSNHDKDSQLPKEPYQFKIIHQGLVEQTRLTRISQRLEDSKDKTEFWMPALPWRCIDYLNLRGCEEEGLYRVPGAAHQVKYYEQKFDQDRDIDLISDDNLNDPNVIGSLFKNWLRQLPDEIFPKTTQARIQQECQGAKSTPQMLKDELSKLPPFNYYLLFAITCHISLLHSWSEFNKMNYNNLCICFQPAIKIDAFCFQFLILDWRNCWQGCWTEKEYLAGEVKLLETPKSTSTATRNGQTHHAPGQSTSSHSSSGFLGDNFQASTKRSTSTDRAASSERKKTSTRGISSDRSLASGGATPPNINFTSENGTSSKHRGISSDRGSTSDRVIPPADRREAYNTRETPKRAPPTLTTDPPADEEDNSATPTQAQHNRGGSANAYRLDLTNPPTSPFSVKF